MKPNSVIRALFAAFFLIIFCFGNPVFAADFGNGEAAVNSYQKKPSPYAVITAARKTNPTTRPLFTLPSFAKQLPQQLNQLRTGLQEQPVRVIDAAKQVGPAIKRRANGMSDGEAFQRNRIHQIPQIIKTALSKALDQAGTKAHQTAEQIRQS